MRIMMVTMHGCIRVFKESLALIEKGHIVDLAASQVPFGHNAFHTFSLYQDAEQLMHVVRSSQADIFHVHNEPDWMVTAVRLATDRPIVFDVHDLISLRHQIEPDGDELSAFASADAFVHVSNTCKAAAMLAHGSKKPDIVLYPYINRRFVNDIPEDVCWQSVCYEGGLATSAEVSLRGDGTVIVNYRDWRGAVRAIREQGFHVSLFSASHVSEFDYENLGAVVHAPLAYPVLLKALRPYAFGLVGSVEPVHLILGAMPNKLFEYMSQGVVPLLINATEAARFCEDRGGLGIEVDNFENLRQLIPAAKEARKKILARREVMVMENHIQPLIDLYEEVA